MWKGMNISMKKIALTVPDFGQNYDQLMGELALKGYELVWMPGIEKTTEGLIKALRGYDAVIAGGEPWSAEVIAGVQDTLRIIARHGVGFDQVDIPAATGAGIAVTNTPGKMSISVAEQALAFMLSITRQTARFDREMRKGDWKLSLTNELTGKTLGLVGFGAIAKALTKLCTGFDLRVLAYDILIDENAVKELNVTPAGLDELLKESDFVSLHLPLNDETEGMVDKDFLSKMKSTAFLINNSRGGLIDEPALIEALKNGEIAGAGLDVYETQPLPQDSELLGMENVVLAPFVGSASRESMARMVACSLENVIALFNGETPPNILNPEYK